MFCLGCGSEIPLRSEYCPVCGQRIGPEGGVAPTPRPKEPSIALLQASGTEMSYTPNASEPAPPTEATMTGETTPRISALSGHPARSSGAIGLGDLEGLAVPRDMAGRVTLGAAAAIIVSVFLPWALFASYSLIPIQIGSPIFVLIGAVVVTAIPTFWTPARRRAPAAALPFGIGACFLGMAIATLAIIGPFAPGFLSQVVLAMTGDTVPDGAQFSVSAGMGLYLFLLAAAALTISGYFMFMEAILAMAPRTQPAPASAPPALPGALAYPIPQGQTALSSPPPLVGSAPVAIPFAQPAPTGRLATPQTPGTHALPQPGDLRWEQEIASPPAVRRPASGGRPGSMRGPHR